MLPPVNSTPEEQRNYFSARKLPVEKVILTKGREAWVCNFCGCWHNCPKPVLLTVARREMGL